MATFKPPPGFPREPDAHVTSPAHHFGYRHLVASLVDGGSRPDYIKRKCADFQEEGAPKDAVGRTETGWRRRTDLTMMLGRKLDTYATALLKYEEELKAERKQEGGW